MDDSNGSEKTVDVLDVSYPLLASFRQLCPGSYSHGKNVASLLEAVGSELGLNVPYLRMAGQYHDIGKRVAPKYFSENIGDDDTDVHADLLPHISYKIIASHVGDTTQILLNDPNIPLEVIRWCSQHHGTSIMQFFFKKSGSKNELNYKYQGTEPATLEAGLLMICDCLEAKCKSLYQAEKLNDIKDVVDDTVEQLINDRQLDNVSLPKLCFLRVIKDVLCRELSSIYKSKRVDYDEAEQRKNNDE